MLNANTGGMQHFKRARTERTMTTGTYINIKRFEIHDGDGMRTTLFLKGCPLRCKWCHNPEGLSAKPELGFYAHKCTVCGRCAAVCPTGAHRIADGVHRFDRTKCIACGKCEEACFADALLLYGKRATAAELLPKLLEDKAFYDSSNGGVTLSGGEPLLQADFCRELLMQLHAAGVNTAVDTCLAVPETALQKVLDFTDTFLVDVKAIDSDLHRRLTGQPNARILENLRLLNALGKRVEIRIPFIPGQNAGEIGAIAAFLSTLSCVVGARVLPYHNLSGTKYESLDMAYPLAGADTPIPTAAEAEAARAVLAAHGVRVLR